MAKNQNFCWIADGFGPYLRDIFTNISDFFGFRKKSRTQHACHSNSISRLIAHKENYRNL